MEEEKSMFIKMFSGFRGGAGVRWCRGQIDECALISTVEEL